MLYLQKKMVPQSDVLHPDVNEVIIYRVDFSESVFFNSLTILRHSVGTIDLFR